MRTLILSTALIYLISPLAGIVFAAMFCLVYLNAKKSENG